MNEKIIGGNHEGDVDDDHNGDGDDVDDDKGASWKVNRIWWS